MTHSDTTRPAGDTALDSAAAKLRAREAERAQAAEGGNLTGRALAALALVAALIAGGWASTFHAMWYRWFPAWHRDYPLMDRLTEGDSYYTHGPLVPLASLVIAALIYRRVRLPARRSAGASLLGWLGFAWFFFIHLMSVYAQVMFVSGFSLIGLLACMLLIWGGWPLLRAYWLPVAFLLFMVPLPMNLIADLNYELKFTAGRASVWLTNHLFGIPTVMHGSYVLLPPGPDGEIKQLVVEDVCSGLRSLISLICFASLFAVICRLRGPWRLFMLAMALPVAVAANVLRITALNLVAHYHSVEAAGPESAFHNLSGLLVFALALALLFGIEYLVLGIGKLLKRDWSDSRLLGYLENVRGVRGMRPAFAQPIIILLLAGGVGWAVLWSQRPTPFNRSDVAKQTVVSEMTLGDAHFTSIDIPLDQQSLDILETDDYLFRHFTANTGDEVSLLIVFSHDNRKGTHPPEVCFTGSGDQVVGKSHRTLDVVEPGGMVFRELMTQRDTQRDYHLYVYKSGDAYTPSFLNQQWRIFINGLLKRNSAGALVRFSTHVRNEDEAAAKKLLAAAVSELMPQIDRKLDLGAR